MKSRLYAVAFCVLALTLSAALAVAQDSVAQDDASAAPPEGDNPLEADTQAEPELTWDDYTVKAYTIQIFGGAFDGDKYLELPVKGDRTQVEEGDDWVQAYDGRVLNASQLDYDIYDGPVKSLENGYTLGVKVGSYLSENFHVDLSLSFSNSAAELTMVNSEDPENVFTEQISYDEGVQVFRGGISGVYDLNRYQLGGIYPYFGFGFGGVIVRYTALEDVGALYLVGTAGIKRQIIGATSAFLQFDLTNYSMSTYELNYTKSVTLMDLVFGLSFYIDTVPDDVRALHQADKAEAASRR